MAVESPPLLTYTPHIIWSPEEMAAAKRMMKGPTCSCSHGTSSWTEFFSDWWVRLQILCALTYVAGMLSVIEPCLENLGPILFVLFVHVPMILMLYQFGPP